MAKKSKVVNPAQYRKAPKKRPGIHSKNKSQSQRKKKSRGQGWKWLLFLVNL